MGAAGTLVVYLVIGLTCAAAVFLRGGRTAGWFVFDALFWPFFVPALLARAAVEVPVTAGSGPREGPSGDPRLRTAEARLMEALGGLEGVAEEVLAPELGRLQQLTATLSGVERRLIEMDALLGTEEFDPERADRLLVQLGERGLADDDPRVVSVAARRRNIGRLTAMRDTLSADLERATLEMEEMSAQVRVLRFADRPQAAVVELIREVADTVEGVTERLISIG
jgi:hypothetical protein